jgi:hypothetical protein
MIGDNLSRRHFVVPGNLSPEAFLATEFVSGLVFVEFARGRVRWLNDAAVASLATLAQRRHLT